MAELRDVMAYFCEHYPHKDDLSKARLTKMIYLADWRMALSRERQVTNLTWVFNHYGPYLDDVKSVALTDSAFNVVQDQTIYGSPKEVIRLNKGEHARDISTAEKAALDHVIEQTKPMNYTKFLKLVYSTYPIATQARYQALDLVKLSKLYRKQLKTLP